VTVLVIGDAIADLSAIVDQFPQEGGDSPLRELGWYSGGMGANVAAALALLGTPVRLCARVGVDPAADIALGAARSAGADLSAVQRDPELPTGICFAAVSPSGERTFFSFRGANKAFELASSALALEGTRWLHMCGHALLEGPQRASALALCEAARREGVPASLDLCLPLLQTRISETLALLPRLRVLFANNAEMSLLFPDLPPEAAVSAAVARGVGMVVWKRGALGCVIADAGGELASPAFHVASIDTNGCGDAFAAGFIHASLRGDAIGERARLANAVGALSATRRGAATSFPSRAELASFLGDEARRTAQ
jgi:sugar/nucleoside kinase (ribokinase family)